MRLASAQRLIARPSGRRPFDVALAEYERRRNEAAMPFYELNCQLAALEPPTPEQRQLRTALGGNQEDTNRFFGVIAGTVPVREFFAPDNIARITGALAAAS